MRPRTFRFLSRFFPAYRGTGGRITHVAPDWTEVRIKLPLNLRTRNYVGTIYGGSMYGAVDPFHMIMLIHLMGPDYVVWDRSATIRFKRPGRTTLYASCMIPPGEVDEIKRILDAQDKVDRTYAVELVDKSGVVHAVVENTVHIARRKPRI